MPRPKICFFLCTFLYVRKCIIFLQTNYYHSKNTILGNQWQTSKQTGKILFFLEMGKFSCELPFSYLTGIIGIEQINNTHPALVK